MQSSGTRNKLQFHAFRPATPHARYKLCPCRLHFDPSTGQITDQWTWRGASTDEAKWLLTRSYKPFDLASFNKASSSSSSSSPHGSPTSSMDNTAAGGPAAVPQHIRQATFTATAMAEGALTYVSTRPGLGRHESRARAKGSALLFREVFGAVPGADLNQLDVALSGDYKCQVRL